MSKRRLMALLLVFVVSLVTLACQTAEPPRSPAATDSAPTPYPTYTPLPTYTSPPTWTPLPTPTLTPRPTPIAVSDDWSATGNWYRDRGREKTLNALLQAQGMRQDARSATLDAVPGAWASELSLSLACLAGIKAAYWSPYTFSVPMEVDTYAIGIWDNSTASWIEGEVRFYYDPVLTDDGAEIYISNQAQVNQMFSILQKAAQLQNRHQTMHAGMYDSNDDGIELWGEFDVTGLAAAAAYLPCFGRMDDE